MTKGIKKRATVDEEKLELNARMGATDGDLSDMLGISEKILVRRYGKLLRRVRAEIRTRLRYQQLAAANKGNATLLTFLGRHELGQNDSKENAVEPVKGYVGIEVEKV